MVLHQRVDDGDGAAQAGRRADLPALHQRAGQVGHRRGPTRGDEDGGRVGGERGDGDKDEKAEAQSEYFAGRRLWCETHAGVQVAQDCEEPSLQQRVRRRGTIEVTLGLMPLQQGHDEARGQEHPEDEAPQPGREGLDRLLHHGPEVLLVTICNIEEIDVLTEEGACERHMQVAPVPSVPECPHAEVEVPHGDVAHASRVAAAVRVEAALGQGPVGQLPPGEA
mmetsp:Transcript_130961/g.407256  ORF Transcript_130961/g.407256 Transcript_130961/m.407256 type:complete len:223 (+) Transcript_130961:675-1343(+)